MKTANSFTKFSELKIKSEIKEALDASGFLEPTPIQALVLPDALDGRDVFGQAQTGTGKTLAFALPIVERVEPEDRFVQAVILVPTRELAKQVSREFEKVASNFKKIITVAIYGGVGQQPQVEALERGAQIVVGTPGRVVDLMRQKQLKLDRVRVAVLDEVDEMLDMGFYDEVHTVMAATPRTRQTMFFSATIPPRIQKMGRSYLRREVVHTTSEENLLVDSTEHAFFEVPGRERLEGLIRIIDTEEISKAIIFTNTKIEADRVCYSLAKRGYPVEGLHGDLPQAKREAVMGRFRSGKTGIIVATDVAARGLDIRDVTHVIHYHIPKDPETFVHRTGRTGRAGASGRSLLIVSPADYHDLFKIQEANQLAIQNLPLPSKEEAIGKRMEKMFDKILSGIISDDISQAYKEMKKCVPFFKRGKALAWLAQKCSQNGFKLDQAGSSAPTSEGARLFINIGRRHGQDEQKIREFIVKESGLKPAQILRLDLRDGYSHLTVSHAQAEQVIKQVGGKKLGRFAVKIEPAKPRESDRKRSERRPRREGSGKSYEQGRSSREGSSPRAGSGVRVRRRTPRDEQSQS